MAKTATWLMAYKETPVHTLKEFLLWTQEVHKTYVQSSNKKEVLFTHSSIYYRGQAKNEWTLTPGIFRKDFLGFISETRLLKIAQLRLANELQSFNSYLDKLVYLQHYGLKTRLLDVTFNPLIALFMTCSSHFDDDGAIYCGCRHDNENIKIAQLTAEFVCTQDPDQQIGCALEEFIKNKKNVSIDNFTLPLFIMPPINNPRIEQQNGAFILAPLITKHDETITANTQSLDNTCFFMENKAFIPHSAKEPLLKELSEFGVNKGSVFRDVETVLQTIITEEQWRTNQINSIEFE